MAGLFGGKGGDGKKSGDSARQDEAKALEKDASADSATATPEEKNAALPDLVQGAVDRAKEGGAKEDRVAFLEEQLAKLTKLVAGLQSRSTEHDGKLKNVKPEDLLPKYVTCGICNQYVTVCKGKHVAARVLPQASENMEGFGGVKINGQNYFGMCLVPVACKDVIMQTVANFETMKRNSRFDLGKIRGWDKEIAMAQSVGLALGMDNA